MNMTLPAPTPLEPAPGSPAAPSTVSASGPDFSGPQYQPYDLSRSGEDRCVRCNAQAYVATAHASSAEPLLWCAHHFTAHKGALTSDPTVKVVADESHRLYARETEVHA